MSAEALIKDSTASTHLGQGHIVGVLKQSPPQALGRPRAVGGNQQPLQEEHLVRSAPLHLPSMQCRVSTWLRD